MSVSGSVQPHDQCEQLTLANGLRVVLAPDPASAVVGVCVVYDVGSRSEPSGRAGFAHLFEHLMFEGSAHVGRSEHFALVQAAGGVANASTHPDFTEFFDAVPAESLERVLFLEADRMRCPSIDTEGLRRQVAVVAAEIRANVVNRPYAGFPGVKVQQALFDTFHNSHDGYGSFAELESATVEDARDFFQHHYAPGNAVLTVAGGFRPETALREIQSLFGAIERRPVAEPPTLDEPAPASERRTTHSDLLAGLPALAVAWRTPDPVARIRDHLPVVALAELLAGRGASRLVRGLVRDLRLAADVSARAAFQGDPFCTRHPTGLVLSAWLHAREHREAVLRAIEETASDVAARPPTPDEMRRVRASLRAQLLTRLDGVLARARRLSALHTVHGDADLAWTLPDLLEEHVTGSTVSLAAAELLTTPRVLVEVLPGSDR